MCTKRSIIVLGSLMILWNYVQVAWAEFRFGEARNLGAVVNSAWDETHPSISSDGLSLYFESNRPGGHGNPDIWVATRATTDSDWSPPQSMGLKANVNLGLDAPDIAADDLTLFFNDLTASLLPGGYGSIDIWMATRPTVHDSWSAPVNPGPPINSGAADAAANLSADGLTLYFMSGRSGGRGSMDIWAAHRPRIDAAWEPALNLGPVINTSGVDGFPAISPDERVLFCNRNAIADRKLYMAFRRDRYSSWERVVEAGPSVNVTDAAFASLSSDVGTLYFSSTRAGGQGEADLWEAPLVPVVDFSADGKVDLVDLVMLIDAWGTANTLCDIGPYAWGDGKVDIEDLKVFMNYYEKANPPASAGKP